MELRREFIVTIGAITALNLAMAFATIGLFARMSPAIERVIKDNIDSIIAAEAMIGEAARPGVKELPRDAQRRLREAFRKASDNITEGEEKIALEAIQVAIEPACQGQDAAKAEILDKARKLIAINRAATQRANTRARNLGQAGAWAAVFSGFLSFALSLTILRRFQKRILAPLVGLYDVLESMRRGEHLRRVLSLDAPAELRRVAQSVNLLLDEHAALTNRPEADACALTDAAAILALLELHPGPALTTDHEGAVARANDAALEVLAGDDGPRLKDALAQLPKGEAPQGLNARALNTNQGWLCYPDASPADDQDA